MTPSDIADILVELIARGGGNEALDPLYDLIADHPGSTNFTMDQGRDALLIAVTRAVILSSEMRRHLADKQFDMAAQCLQALTRQFDRIATLAAFLARSGEEKMRFHAAGLPVSPLNPFGAD